MVFIQFHRPCRIFIQLPFVGQWKNISWDNWKTRETYAPETRIQIILAQVDRGSITLPVKQILGKNNQVQKRLSQVQKKRLKIHFPLTHITLMAYSCIFMYVYRLMKKRRTRENWCEVLRQKALEVIS